MARSARPARIHACNVLADLGERTRLWSFVGSEARPAGVLELAIDQPIPTKVAGKSWGQLARPRLNIAWVTGLPVFLQLVHLPTDDPTEVPAMLELQLEKLSPLPVGQVVWSHEVLPQKSVHGLGVLVLLTERDGLAEQLGLLEKRGFIADRVESPLLRLVAETPLSEDGAYLWVYPLGTRRLCLVGWVADGSLRVLNVVNLSDDERWRRQLTDELDRLAWVGELEGWFEGGVPRVHLLADAPTLAAWRDPLAEALGAPIQEHERPADATVAAASARRAVDGRGRANLLPADFGARYRQEFTDRLWMGGLLGLFAAYLVGVLLYLGAVEVQKLRQSRWADDVSGLSGGYTNTLRLKAQMQVLQETVNLRYAALDGWLAAVEAMPESLTLESLTFSAAQQSLSLSGTAPEDQQTLITEYWQALRRKVAGNTNLFAEVQLRPTTVGTFQGARRVQWGFNCRLQRPEI